MNKLAILGIVLVFVGLLGFAIPYFTTQHTENVARVGDLKLQTTETDHHSIPPLLAGGVLLLGLVLTGVGLTRRA